RRRLSRGMLLCLFALVPGNDVSRKEVGSHSNWRRANGRADEQWLADCEKSSPVAPWMPFPMQPSERRRPAVWIVQKAKADVIFPAIDNWHQGQNDVVEGSGDDRCEDVASRKPGEKNGRQCLQPK